MLRLAKNYTHAHGNVIIFVSRRVLHENIIAVINGLNEMYKTDKASFFNFH